MFPSVYFGPHYFAGHYFPHIGGVPVIPSLVLDTIKIYPLFPMQPEIYAALDGQPENYAALDGKPKMNRWLQ